MRPAEPRYAAATWAKSSHSGPEGASCVEVARVSDWVGVRDTKQHGAGPTLSFTHGQWAGFLAELPRE